MDSTRPTLHATLTNASTNEVRHLIIEHLDGAFRTELVQLSATQAKVIMAGTEYETTTHADALIQKLVGEGFKWIKSGRFAFEPLGHAKALALRMGFTKIYVPNSKEMDPRRGLNLTGEVPISKWPGVQAKNNGEYEYAFDLMRLHAQPVLPREFSTTTPALGTTEFVSFLQNVIKARNSIGPTLEFVLSDR